MTCNTHWLTPEDTKAITQWARITHDNSPTRNLPPKSYRTRPLLTPSTDLTNILTWDERPATLTHDYNPAHEEPITNVYTLIVQPHNHTNQPTLAIDAYQPTDPTNPNPEWRIHNITPVRATIEGWDDPDGYYITDNEIDWIPLTDDSAYDLHPCHPLTQRFIEKGIEWYTNNGSLNETEP